MCSKDSFISSEPQRQKKEKKVAQNIYLVIYTYVTGWTGSRLRPEYLLGGVDHSETVAKLQGPENCGQHSHYQSARYLLREERLMFRQGQRRTDEWTHMKHCVVTKQRAKAPENKEYHTSHLDPLLWLKINKLIH